MEEYSEGRVHKSEPESRNGNVNTVYFNNQARGNSRISRTEFVYDEREHAMANFYFIFELPAQNMFVKIYFYKLVFTLKHYKLM